MARIETNKKINPTQLGVELGRVPLRHVAGSHVDAEGVTAANLTAAVDAHVADDAYVDPEYVAPEPEPTVEDRLAAVEAEVQGMRDRAAATVVASEDARKVRDAVAGP